MWTAERKKRFEGICSPVKVRARQPRPTQLTHGQIGRSRDRVSSRGLLAGKNDFYGAGEILRGEVGRLSQRLGVMALDENGAATGRVAAIHITPAVPNHPTARQINVQLARRPEQHARLRFATIAIRLALSRMEAGLDPVERQVARHILMHVFDRFARDQTAANIGLIGGNDEEESGLPKPPASVPDAGQNLELADAGGWIRHVVANDSAVDHAIPVQEDRAPGLRVHRVLSHLVCATFNLG